LLRYERRIQKSRSNFERETDQFTCSTKVKATRQPLMGDPSAMEYCFKNEKQKQHADPDLNSLLEFFQTAGTFVCLNIHLKLTMHVENNVFDSINRFQHLIKDWKGLTARFKEKDEPVHDVKPATVRARNSLKNNQ
jgi:hypothetical protein